MFQKQQDEFLQISHSISNQTHNLIAGFTKISKDIMHSEPEWKKNTFTWSGWKEYKVFQWDQSLSLS